MASSSGSGFTASIVNGIANYVSSDLSNLGMANNVTGAIQYVKMVWGASGEANLISDDPVDPSSLPVSLNTPENRFLTDALINGMTNANGVTAFSVRILDASGISLGAVSINLGTGMTIVGFAAGATNANLGVTFGAVSMSGGHLPVTNRIIGGVTQSLQVTGGVYVLGGSVAVTGLELGSLNLDLSGGITINGMTGTNKLGVTFEAATISGTVDTNIKSIAGGVTFPMVLTKSDGSFLGIGSGGSLMVSGVTGATPIGITMSGTMGTTFGAITGGVYLLGTPAITGSVNILGTPAITGSVNILGTPAITGSVNILGTPTVKIEPKTTGTTFGIVFTDRTGTALGMSGGLVVGLPVFGVLGATAINVTIVGGFSGITISGISFPSSFDVSGGTINNIVGGTLDHIKTIGLINGGTLNIGNTVDVTGSISISNWSSQIFPTSQSVEVNNSEAIEIVPKIGFVDKEGTSLKEHLHGLEVTLIGGGGGACGGLGDVTSIRGVSMGFGVGSGMTGITGIGVTFASISVASLPSITIGTVSTYFPIKGHSDTRGANASDPVGISLTGKLAGLSAYGVSGEYLGVTLVGVGMSGDALKVVIVGGLSGITISGFSFPTSFTVSGGTLGVSGGTLDHIRTIGFINGGTLNIGNTVGITGSVKISEVAQGITFKTVLVDQNGNILTNEKGIPVFGVSGATAIGITWSGTPTFGISGPVSVQQVLGSTFAVVFTNNFGNLLGMSGPTVVGMPVFGVLGATAIGVTFTGVSIVGTVNTTATLSFPVTGVTMKFGDNFGNLLGMSGPTVVGLPVFGVSGATAIGVTGTVAVQGLSYDFDGNAYISIWRGVTVVGTSDSNIGVTFGTGKIRIVGEDTLTSEIQVKTKTGTLLGVTGTVAVQQVTGSTFAVVFTNNFGNFLGMSGPTVVGLPVFGVLGATAIGVTFGAITFGANGMGVTFGGITFNTTRTIITGTSFGLGLGVPVYGVQGVTAVQVTIVGGTISGIFTTEPQGITVTGVATGIPVFGVLGATAIGVTFSAGSVGTTFGGITGSVNILGTPSFTGSVNILGTPSVSISGSITSISNDVNVAPASAFKSSNTTVLAGRTAAGFVVTQRAGSNFARGLTLNSDFISTTVVVGGLTFSTLFFNTNPVCVTKDYTGPGRVVGAPTIDGQNSVPLKVGLYIQLTKWDLISHVLVGYTAGTTQEFARNAQTLTREYQVAPIWGNAMEQFRKYAGASGNSSTFTDPDINGSVPTNDEMVQKQFIGVIEKPTRLFIPCKDAGEIYVQVIGDYRNHTIGSGFWSYENGTGAYSTTTLYERGYYGSDYSGFGGSIDLDVNGNPTGGGGGGIQQTWGAPDITAAIAAITGGYANNPFIRIWGH